MKKNLLILLILAALGGGIAGFYLFTKQHPDLQDQQPAYTLDASALFAEFEADENAANTKYLDKLLEVQGTVAEVSESPDGGITLVLRPEDAMMGVQCSFLPEQSEAAKKLSPGSKVRVKGICTGMLMDVNLSRCVLVPES
ncbi:MAG: hypothetical protein D6730_25600 [Bacteroidetes bacterium]|nr:MAG: hypothetical protein D6730_25600 [Bacteroidota bacterium]